VQAAKIYIELLGIETHFCDTGRYRMRVLAMNDKPALFLLHGSGGHA
jgi:hypothetical protein